MRLPDGAIYAPRLRGPGDDVLHRQYHVRRISRETVRSAPAAQTSCVGRSSRKKNRPRVLRLLGPRQSKTVVLNCSGGRCSGGAFPPGSHAPPTPDAKGPAPQEKRAAPEAPRQLCPPFAP